MAVFAVPLMGVTAMTVNIIMGISIIPKCVFSLNACTNIYELHLLSLYLTTLGKLAHVVREQLLHDCCSLPLPDLVSHDFLRICHAIDNKHSNVP